MKKNYFFLCLLLVAGISVKSFGQTDPGIVNLTHQWTFDDGTAKDNVGTADGVLEGSAIIANKALVTTNGGYLTFPSTDIGINSYTEITAEAWFTSGLGANTGYTMLSYFGNTTGTVGTDYISLSAARGDGFSRAAISTGNTSTPWATENGVNSAKYDDGLLHHMVSVFAADGVTFYIDGTLIGTTAFTGTNAIASIGTQFAYLAKGGYTSDPTWKGSIHKFSLYNKALSADNILYLFQKGPEKDAVITSTVSSLAFDTNYPAEVFNISSTNLTAPITVSSPAGILILDGAGNPLTSLDANLTNVPVTAVYDGSVVAVDGNITFTSGSIEVTIPVKSVSDATCYAPMYSSGDNYIVNPGMSSLSTFQGWGTRNLVTIITDPSKVYCGAASIEVGDGVNTGSGSLDQTLVPLNAPNIVKNTVYKGKAMVKTMDGSFQIGLSGTDPDVIVPINTNGEWQEVNFTFTTGANMTTTPLIYFNNYACTGKTAYIDNYQIFVAQNSIITPSVRSYVADDKSGKNFKITSLAANLKSDITITSPAGIVVNPSTISKDLTTPQTITATYDGTTDVTGDIVLTSDTVIVKIAVTSDKTSSTCFTPLYTDRPNLNADPYLNNISLFGGWGAKTFVSAVENPDSVFCGTHSGRILSSGSIDVVLTGQLRPNTTYVSKAKIRTFDGPFQLGIYGVAAADITDSINTKGEWQDLTFEFATSDSLRASYGLYFNNYNLKGTRGFIDNWELYRKDTVTAVSNVKELFENIYVQNGKIVAEFDLENASPVQFAVYSIQGTLVSDERISGIEGRNKKVFNSSIPSGVYLIKMTQNGQSRIKKVVK